MNIAFLVPKNSVLQHMGCLIDECLKNNHKAIIFYNSLLNTNARVYQNFIPSDSSNFLFGDPEFIEFNFDTLVYLCQKNKIDVLVINEGYIAFYRMGLLNILQDIKKLRIKLVSLSNYIDIAIWPLEALEYFDKTYYMSEFAKDAHFNYNFQSQKEKKYSREESFNKYKEKYEVIGSATWDQLARSVDPSAIKRKYNIDPNKKVVLFTVQSIFDVGLWHSIVWRDSNKLIRSFLALRHRRPQYLKDIWLAPSHEIIVKAIKKFCQNNNAVLIIKSRGKCPHFKYLIELADNYIYGFDDEYYPLFTTFQLLAISNLCISNYSFSLIEAVIKNVPAVCINSGPLHDFSGKDKIYLQYNDFLYNDHNNNIFNYPGCIYNVDHRKFVDWFSNKSLADFVIDNRQRQAYLGKFIGPIDSQNPASKQILSSMERLVNG